ncbi:uncharacterized protein K444DRAFT_502503, partial [Hyaloscypha bicolor E]
ISFGYGLKEILGVSRLASRVASDCRGACGEHDVSTRDVAGLHAVLRRLEDQATKPESLLGRVEREIRNALPEIRESLNWITAKLSAGNEGSILTSYSGDDKGVWKELRRELILEGFASPHISQHKAMIMDYFRELGER